MPLPKSNIDWNLVTASASALAAGFSALAARSANRIARLTYKPELRARYDAGEDKLYVKNVGKGPALNIKVQANSVYYYDIKKTYLFQLSDHAISNVYPDEEVILDVNLSTKKSDSTDDLIPASYAFAYNLGKDGEIGIIFSDTSGKRFITKMKSRFRKSQLVGIESIKTKSYGLSYRLFDKLTSSKSYLKVSVSIRKLREDKK